MADGVGYNQDIKHYVEVVIPHLEKELSSGEKTPLEMKELYQL